MKIRAIFILHIICSYTSLPFGKWMCYPPHSVVFFSSYVFVVYGSVRLDMYVHQHIIHHVGNPFAIDVWASQLNIFIVTLVISFIYVVDHSLCEISKLLRVSMQFIQRKMRRLIVGCRTNAHIPNDAGVLCGHAPVRCVPNTSGMWRKSCITHTGREMVRGYRVANDVTKKEDPV